MPPPITASYCCFSTDALYFMPSKLSRFFVYAKIQWRFRFHRGIPAKFDKPKGVRCRPSEYFMTPRICRKRTAQCGTTSLVIWLPHGFEQFPDMHRVPCSHKDFTRLGHHTARPWRFVGRYWCSIGARLRQHFYGVLQGLHVAGSLLTRNKYGSRARFSPGKTLNGASFKTIEQLRKASH